MTGASQGGGANASANPVGQATVSLYRLLSSFILLGLLGLAVAATFSLLAAPVFATCDYNPYRRSSNPDALHSAWVPSWARHLFMEQIPQLSWLLLVGSVARKTRSVQRWPFIMGWLVVLGLWLPGIRVVEVIKDWSNDNECLPMHRDDGNAMSGHFFFFAWSLGCLHAFGAWAAEYPGGLNPTLYKVVSRLWTVLFCVEGVVTWTYGYHSPRQCVLGLALGLMYAALCVRVGREVYHRMQLRSAFL